MILLQRIVGKARIEDNESAVAQSVQEFERLDR